MSRLHYKPHFKCWCGMWLCEKVYFAGLSIYGHGTTIQAASKNYLDAWRNVR